MASPIVMLMILAWLLSGALSSLLAATGFVDALVWSARALDLRGGLYAGAAFLVCALVSTSTGTSFGTLLVCGPLLYPAGAGAGAHPAVLLGAILGGATFGDSISPVSDTTIASAGTQRADIGGTVRARLKYVLPAGVVAVLAAVLFGGVAQTPGASVAAVATGSARGLPMLLVPALVVALLLARRHLVEALLLGLLAALVLALPLGLLRPEQLLVVEPGSFAAKSVLIDGLERGVGVSVFTLLLVGLVAALDASGAVARATALAGTGGSLAGAEARIVAMLTVAVVLTTHSVVAILAVGPYVSAMGAAPWHRRVSPRQSPGSHGVHVAVPAAVLPAHDSGVERVAVGTRRGHATAVAARGRAVQRVFVGARGDAGRGCGHGLWPAGRPSGDRPEVARASDRIRIGLDLCVEYTSRQQHATLCFP